MVQKYGLLLCIFAVSCLNARVGTIQILKLEKEVSSLLGQLKEVQAHKTQERISLEQKVIEGQRLLDTYKEQIQSLQEAEESLLTPVSCRECMLSKEGVWPTQKISDCVVDVRKSKEGIQAASNLFQAKHMAPLHKKIKENEDFRLTLADAVCHLMGIESSLAEIVGFEKKRPLNQQELEYIHNAHQAVKSYQKLIN